MKLYAKLEAKYQFNALNIDVICLTMTFKAISLKIVFNNLAFKLFSMNIIYGIECLHTIGNM